MRPPDIPHLFDRVPATLLGPLASGQSSLYWDVLAEFYHLEFEREPFFLVKNAAIEVSEEILRTSSVWLERREDILSDTSLVAMNAEDAAPPPAAAEEAALPCGPGKLSSSENRG